MTFDEEDLRPSSYFYHLPPELVAQRPVEGPRRDHSRLLVYRHGTGEVIHDFFYNLPRYLPPASLLVFNQSKVFPSRLKGHKKSGGRAELFFLERTENSLGLYAALIKTRSKKVVGDTFLFPENCLVELKALGPDGTFYVAVHLPAGYSTLLDYLEAHALIPIPPYIRKGESDEEDKKDYQTIYGKEEGSVAAPTAGLHFTPELMEDLVAQGIERAFVTLHVGLGTFRPVTAHHLKDHQMHAEEYFIDRENAKKIAGGASQVIAVGTTALRVLESSYGKELIPDKRYSTDIFLHPGVEVASVSGLITNFHLPQSTLLMLVSAMIGRKKTLELYELAVKEKYRFFSYGDAMLILR